MLSNPVIEQYRIEKDGAYVGTITLAYPNRSTAIALGFVSSCPLTRGQITELIKHIKKTGRSELIFYREKNGKEVEKRYEI